MSQSNRKYENSFRYIGLGTEIPCMVIVGVFVGNLLGQQFGGFWSTWGVILGAIFGFLLGVFNIYQIINQEEKERNMRKLQTIQKKEQEAESD